MPVSKIQHNGKEIIFIDNHGLTGDALLKNIQEGTREFIKKGKDVLAMADFTDANLSKEAVEYLKCDESKEAAKLVVRQAVFGMSGIKKMVLNVYNKIAGINTRAVNTMEEAKEYLTN